MVRRVKKKKSRRKSPLPLVLAGMGLILVALAATIFIPKGSPQKDSHVGLLIPGEVSYPAPALSLTDVKGTAVSLADYHGQVVLINNWATWCPPCRAEMPELEAYFRAHKDENFSLIGINAGDSQAQVADFIQEYRVTSPMWLDPTGLALHAFQNNALPSSYVVDKSGTVRFAWTGGISQETLEQYVTPLLEE